MPIRCLKSSGSSQTSYLKKTPTIPLTKFVAFVASASPVWGLSKIKASPWI